MGLSTWFVALGLMVTKTNADKILPVYNTLDEHIKTKVDVRKYLALYKSFHIFLGLSFSFVGLFLFNTMSQDAEIIFFTTYPVIAYIFFIIRSRFFFKGIPLKTIIDSVF